MRQTLRATKGSGWATNTEHIVGTKNGAMGARTLRRLELTKRSEISWLLEKQGVPQDLVPKIDARSTRQMTNQAVQVTVLLRRLITNTSSEWNSAAREHSSSSSDQFQKSTADSDECECSCNAHTRLFCRRRLFKAQLKSTSPTKRAAETTTLDVPPQAKRPRVEGSTFEV